MVRKRAPAEKALSPPKENHSRKIDRNNSDETPAKKVRTEDCQQTQVNDVKHEEVNNINPVIETEVLNEQYNDLPDAECLAKELTEKGKSYWNSARQDCHDFSNWTCLLQHITEAEDNLEAARCAYNVFLRYYPYCYGYWKKFSDIEKKNGNIEQARQVFDRGVEAIPVSIDLWVQYLNFTIQQNKGKDGQAEIRNLFKRAINAASLEFKSTKLWDTYIEWEKSLGSLKNVTEIFDQLISTPTQQYLKNWKRFKSHLEAHSPGDILPGKEYGKLMKEMDAFPPGMVIDEEKPPGEDDKNDAMKYQIDEDDGAMKETYTEVRKRVLIERESIFRETSQEIVKRWKFEENIKRPYFHVKPLEKAQIKNWKDYLDFEINEGNHKRIIFLFERCMVVCAMYEVFWEKYLNYVETIDTEQARSVFNRACTIHLMKKFKLHLRWATFEERHKNYSASATILQKIDENFPGMVLLTQRRAGLARRMHDHQEMVSIYERAIEAAERIEDKIFYSIKLSHVLAKYCCQKEHARDVLWSALKLGKKHKRIYLQLLDLEMHYGDVEMAFVNKLFSSIENDMSVGNDFHENCAQRKVEFYEEYGDDIDRIIEVQEAYRSELKKKEAKLKDSNESKSSKSSVRNSRKSTDGHRQQAASFNDNAQYTHQQHYQQQQQQNQSWYLPNPPSDQQHYDWQNYGQYSQYNHQQ